MVTLAALKTLLTAALDAQDRAFESKLVAFSQQQAEQAERTHLAGQLGVHGWTAQDCASMPLAALRKVVQVLAPSSETNWPDDAPKGWE